MADVNGTTTPSGKEVELVSSDKWMDMTIVELFDQKITLNNRYAIVAQYGNPSMLKQIQIGLQQIDMILRYKEVENNKSNKNKKDKSLTGLI